MTNVLLMLLIGGGVHLLHPVNVDRRDNINKRSLFINWLYDGHFRKSKKDGNFITCCLQTMKSRA